MNLRFNTDDDFLSFKNELRKRLSERDIHKIDRPDYIPSAVMILIMKKNNEAHVFLTKRTSNVSTHKGEISFPGGAIDEGDKSSLDAALRETFEEAGVNPEDIEVLGRFDDFVSFAGFHVSTFVGTIGHPYEYKINPAEIESCLEAPLSIFCNREYDRIEYYKMDGADYPVYFYSFGGYTIWGLTARILTELGQRVFAG